MHIPGRFWWIHALLASACGAGAVVFPTLYIGGSISSESAAGTFSATSALIDDWFMYIYALIFLVGSIYPIYVSAWSLWGFRRRRAAVRGDQDAMLPATPPIALGEIPNLASSSLVLQWRRKRVPLYLRVFGALLMALPLAPLGYLLIAVFSEMAQSSDILGFLRSQIKFFVGMLVCLVLGGILLTIYVRMQRFQAKHAIGVIATTTGLECVSQFGRRSFISWAEARLFEVDSPYRHGVTPIVYRLYSSHDVAEWTLFTAIDSFARVGLSADGTPVGEGMMARVIVAHTGLQPRTLAKPLALTIPTLAIGQLSTSSPPQ